MTSRNLRPGAPAGGALVLALILAAAPAFVFAALSPEETVAAAERAEKAGAFQQAVTLYGEFLAANPDHIQRPTVQYRLALCYDGMGLTEKAAETLKQVLAAPAERGGGKHRPDAFMRLAKLQADAGRHQEAAATLEGLFKEGAGLYEDEAQNLQAGYLAILNRHEDAAVLFNILRNKPSSPFAQEAAYKLAIVWIKAGNTELAKAAVEEFVQRYPAHAKGVELFVRIAQAYYEQKQYKSAVDVCQQVLNDYKEAPEAIEAAFIAALCFRASGKLDVAVERFERAAAMPQATHNTVVASEALFEAAQICRKTLNQPDRAADLYRQAAIKSQDPLTERQQQILEQSLFYEAEHYFQKEKWAAAHDLYMQLRKMGSKLNLLSRVLYCQSKMSATGDASLMAESEEELALIRQRIADNPGTLVALQSEIFLVDRKLLKLRAGDDPRQVPPWSSLEPIRDEYAALLRKYPPAVTSQQNLDAYIKMRMAGVYTCVAEDDPQRKDRSLAGVALFEEALALAPQALFRVEALEGLAILAARSGLDRKSFDAYQKLYAITGESPDAAGARRPPSDYLQGLVATARSMDLADEAIRTMEQVIASKPAGSEDVREARYYLAELYYMKQRFSEAAAHYKDFVRLYGPPQGTNGAVLASWKRPGAVDKVLDQVYECGLRVAHCWRTQGHTANMLAAYRWVVANQNHLNPRVAEAWYMVLNTGVDYAKLDPARRQDLARELWTRMVNGSMDIGSKAFREGFYPWVRDPRAIPYVRVAVLKTGQLLADAGQHRQAAQVFQQYLALFGPGTGEPHRQRDPRLSFPMDEDYYSASYAAGREFILADDLADMVEVFGPYVNGMRESRFRASALQLLAHYATRAEMYQDAADAYAVLLDEYGPPNPRDGQGRPIPVPPAERLRRETSWNGVRLAPPEKWDPGKIRYGLGFLHWKKEAWDACYATLAAFEDNPELRGSPARAEALFMAGRCQVKQGFPTKGLKIFERIVADHPAFKAIEEVYVDLARGAAESTDWALVEKVHRQYVTAHPQGLRRPYMDLYAAVAQVGRGQAVEGERTLRDLMKADVYADVKAEACLHVARLMLKAARPDRAAAMGLLRRSVELHPLAPALLEAARCAFELKDWPAAREYSDRLVREFPKAGKSLIEEAQQLRRKVMEAEAQTRR